jgi:hypothetical protein
MASVNNIAGGGSAGASANNQWRIISWKWRGGWHGAGAAIIAKFGANIKAAKSARQKSIVSAAGARWRQKKKRSWASAKSISAKAAAARKSAAALGGGKHGRNVAASSAGGVSASNGEMAGGGSLNNQWLNAGKMAKAQRSYASAASKWRREISGAMRRSAAALALAAAAAARNRGGEGSSARRNRENENGIGCGEINHVGISESEKKKAANARAYHAGMASA